MGGGPSGGNTGTNFSYTFHGDPRATFAQFFGTNNPFESFFNMGHGSFFNDDVHMDTGADHIDPFASLGGGLGGFGPRTPFRSQSFNVGSHTRANKDKPQDPPVEHDLYVNLEDIAKGVTKRMKISRRVVGADGSVRKEEKVLTINVKPGWKSGTKITFQREGDQAPNKIPADIVFIIRDKPHPLFKREGSDLKYVAKITLKEVSASEPKDGINKALNVTEFCNYVSRRQFTKNNKGICVCTTCRMIWRITILVSWQFDMLDLQLSFSQEIIQGFRVKNVGIMFKAICITTRPCNRRIHNYFN